MRGFAVGLSVLLGAMMYGVVAPAHAATCPNDAFRTGHGATLPDCRAFELVSPTTKASDVAVNTTRFRMSADASTLPRAVVFQSLGGFADPNGSGVAFDYMAQRTLTEGTQGWATHALNPVETPMGITTLAIGNDPLFVGEGNPDLTQMAYRTLTPLGMTPPLDRILKLFLRSDLRTAGAGSYTPLMTPLVPVASPSLVTGRHTTYMPGASDDLRKVLIESVYPLTPDAPASTDVPKLYKSIDGVIHLAGVLPTSEGGGPASASVAGQSAGTVTSLAFYTPHVLSRDGSRAIFTVPPADSSDGRGPIYMRDDAGTDDTDDDFTVRVDESERTVPDGPGVTFYWDATPDGSRVFFTSSRALTDDADDTGVQELYMYDASKPASEDNVTHLSRDHEPADAPNDAYSVIGVADDGRTVYFVQRGQIVRDAPVLNNRLGIYVWREGAGVRYLGEMVEDKQDPADATTGVGHLVANQVGAYVTPDGSRLLLSLREPPLPSGADQGDCGGAGRRINGKVGCPRPVSVRRRGR